MVPMRYEKYTNKKYQRKRRLETLLSLVILLAVFTGALSGYYGSKVVSFLDGISADSAETEVETPESIEMTRKIEDLEPFSALILGLDIEDEGASRSDTIIAVTVNPEKESVKMVSIPRDTLVTLPNGQMEKINAAYATGGPNAPHRNAINAMDAVGDFLNIPIEFYATMDFNGLIELVDAVGGITVDADFAFSERDYVTGQLVEFNEGKQTLNGADALAYARMRKKDPRGDFGRQDRQREVIIEVLNELVSVNTLANLPTILKAVQPYLQTNASSNHMLSIASNYTSVLSDIEQLEINGYDDTEYFPHYGHNVYVWLPYQESLNEVQYELRTHLELDTEDYIDIQPQIENASSIETESWPENNTDSNQY